MKRLSMFALPVALAAAVVVLAQEADAGRKYALLVGVSKYDGTGLTSLKYAEKDATDLKAALDALGYKVTLVTRAEFKRTDADHLDPTAENVRDHLAAIARNRKPDDTVLVALSGHGVHLKSTDKLYYCPARANLGKPDTLVAVDDVMAALKPFDPATGTGCRANNKVLLMDACRNDPSDGRSATDGKFASLTRPLVPDPPGGTVALFSCSKGQISHESDEFKRGFLMHYVIDALGGKAANAKTGVISWDKLVAHVKEEVPAAVVEQKGPKVNQLPESLGRASVLALGRVAVSTADGTTDRVVPPPRAEGQTFVSKTTGMKFVRIKAGTFTMGSPKDEEGRDNDEAQHEVTLTKDFYLGVTEVTQKEWRAVMGTTPWQGKEYVKEGDEYPATYVSWDDAVGYAERLSKADGRAYRLPTEAEWEYSCRGGATSKYHFGDGPAALADHAWFDKNAFDVGEKFAHRVASKKTNPFGLFDMHGNVWEWCSDWHGAYPSGRGTDPVGPSEGSLRVYRGGSWDGPARRCRSAYRGGNDPSIRNINLGFRLALVPAGR